MSKRNHKKKHGHKKKAQAKQRSSRAGKSAKIMEAIGTAVRHHQAGDLSQAESLYRKVLRADPHQPDALHLLGVIAHQVGKNDQAVEWITKALAVKPDFAEAHNNLGYALKKLERNEEAVISYRKAIAIQPNHLKAHINLGNTLQELGRSAEAVASFGRALAMEPNSAGLLTNHGDELQRVGRWADAIVSYEQALAIKPNLAILHSCVGCCLKELGKPEEAETSFQRALAIAPDCAVAFSNLGTLYERTNRLEEADRCIRRALEIDPDLGDAILCSAVLMRRGGRDQEAIKVLEQWTLEKLPGEKNPQRAYFELGKLYDRAHDSQRAFECFTKGNQTHSEDHRNQFHAENYLQSIEMVTRMLTADFIDSWPLGNRTHEVDSPVFLVGFPRSGTTLLDQILGGHPRLQVMEEKPAIDSIVMTLNERAEEYPSVLASFQGAEIDQLCAQYFESVDQHIDRHPNSILVDKLPLNIPHIPLIMRLFPDARIILALRHPCDVVLSNFMQIYKLNDAMENFHTLESTANLYQQIMSFWLQCVELLPLKVHAIKYEDVVANLEGEAKRLIGFLDLEWDESVLDYRAHALQKKRIYTPSYEQVVEPIYQRAKYRWKRYEQQLQPVLKQLEPFVEAFGYVEP